MAAQYTPLRSTSPPRGEKPWFATAGLFHGTSKTSVSAVSGGFAPGVSRITAPGNPNVVPHTDPSAAGDSAYTPPPYCPVPMRLSLAGSTGAFGSTYSSRRPFPLTSRISAVHPCALSSSPVSSHSLVSNHPTTGPPPLVQRVLLASSANIRWCVPKQVATCFISFVLGSYTARWRPEALSGKRRAEGWLDPSLQKAGLSGGRTLEVIQTRPFSSSIGLCTFARLVQIASVPQYGEGTATCCGDVGPALESRSVTGTWAAVWVFGS